MSGNRAIWLMILATAAILMITMGLRMSLGLFVQPIIQTTALDIAAISLAMATTQLIWGVSQPLSGALADKFGVYPVLIYGTILLIAGCFLTPFWASEFGLILTIGFMIALGSGAGSFSILMSLIANRVPVALRGIASGVLNAGGSFGQFLFAPIVGAVIAVPAMGWKGAMFVLGGISLLIFPLSYWIMRGRGANGLNLQAKPEEHKPKTEAPKITQILINAFKDKSYILLNLGFFTCGFHIAFLVTHLPTEIALCGLPASVSSSSISIIGIANVVGSLAVGWCIGIWRSKYILFCMYASRVWLIIVYLAELRYYEWGFYIFSAGLGLTWLATVPPTASITGKLFGTRYLATLFGVTLLSHQIGGFLGAYLGGIAIKELGDYSVMWYVDMVLAGIAAVLNLPIREDKITKTA